MGDIVKGLVSGGTNLLFGWVFPIAAILGLMCYVVIPASHTPLATKLHDYSATDLALVLAFAVLVLAVFLNALSTQLYRFLEGYSWPKPARDWGRSRQSARWVKIKSAADLPGNEVDRAIVWGRLDRFPTTEGQIAPTAFGNALRAFETFGLDRYRLDSQAFWTELTTVAPESLRTEIGRSRASVDFFVVMVFSSGGLAAASAAIAVWAPEGSRMLPWGSALVAVLTIPVWYRAAISSTTYWNHTVRALVNMGRKDLATALGLQLPTTLAEERTMWEAVAAFNFYQFDDDWVDLLDRYRSAKATPPDHKSEAQERGLGGRVRRLRRRSGT